MSFNFASLKKNLTDLSNNAMQAATNSQLDFKFHQMTESVGQTVSQTTSNLPSLAAKTQRYVEEKLGRVTDISQLPSEFTELENRVLRYKIVYENLLKVTSTFDSESYDYPQHVKESFNSFQSTVTKKAIELSKATSASEAQKILINQSGSGETKPKVGDDIEDDTAGNALDAKSSTTNNSLVNNRSSQLEFPKTLNYALSKASLQSCEILNKSSEDENVSVNFLKFANVQHQIGDYRLEQDTQIQLKFNKHLKSFLKDQFEQVSKCRRVVNDTRLEYDISRSNLANNKVPTKDEQLRFDMESKEDKFAQATEDAIMVFTKVLHESDIIDLLKKFSAAQIDYHKKSLEALNELQLE